MADSGGETEPSLQVTGAKMTKVKLHNKRNYEKENKQKMMKYYSDPEKKSRLLERIKEYEEQSRIYQLKANELKQYIESENQTQ
jgi:hypothetical protein